MNDSWIVALIIGGIVLFPAIQFLVISLKEQSKEADKELAGNQGMAPVQRTLEESFFLESEGFSATLSYDQNGRRQVTITGPFAEISLRSASGQLEAEGDPPLVVALLDPATRAHAELFVREGGALEDGYMRMQAPGGDALVRARAESAMRLAVALRRDRRHTSGLLLSRFRDRSLSGHERRSCFELLVEEGDAGALVREAIDDPSPLVASFARMLSPGHRIFHVGERKPAELAGEITRTRSSGRRRILDALNSIGEPAEQVLCALLFETWREREEEVDDLDRVLDALASGGSQRSLESLHAFIASRPPGGARLTRGAQEAIAKIRARHPESAGGQLSVVGDEKGAGALSVAGAETGALSDAGEAKPRKQPT